MGRVGRVGHLLTTSPQPATRRGDYPINSTTCESKNNCNGAVAVGMIHFTIPGQNGRGKTLNVFTRVKCVCVKRGS